MCLSLGSVGRRDAVDDGLGLLVTDLLVVVDDVAQVVSTTVVGLAHRHGVVRQVDIAVIAEDYEVEVSPGLLFKIIMAQCGWHDSSLYLHFGILTVG